MGPNTCYVMVKSFLSQSFKVISFDICCEHEVKCFNTAGTKYRYGKETCNPLFILKPFILSSSTLDKQQDKLNI